MVPYYGGKVCGQSLEVRTFTYLPLPHLSSLTDKVRNFYTLLHFYLVIPSNDSYSFTMCRKPPTKVIAAPLAFLFGYYALATPGGSFTGAKIKCST